VKKAPALKTEKGKVLNMNPPTGIEIITLLVLGVVAIALFEYVAYTAVKTKYGDRITCREMLRLQMIVLKPAIIDMTRIALLWIVMILPLYVIIVSTDLSIIFVIESLLGKVRSPLPGDIEITISFLFLLANITIMHYFLGKYGSIYKLPLMFLVRDDARQLLKKHQKVLQDILMGLVVGSVMYVMMIMTLLVALVNLPSFLSKIDVGIVIVLLLVYVLPNKKYENAIELIEKIWSK